MKKILLLLLAGAVCSSSLAQRQVKYKDIYAKIGKEPAEHSLLKLNEYQKIAPEFANTYVQTGLIQWSWLQNEDPYLNYEYVQTLIYNAKLYLGMAINKIQKDDKEVKKNKAFYTNLGLGTNADELKQEEVLAELNRLLSVVKEYEENVTKIISNFNKTIEKYNECISIYNGIVGRQSNYKHLLLTSSKDLRDEMEMLSQKYDSANVYFKQFKSAQNAYRKYKLANYNQQTKTTPIVTYRLEGLTSSNFINPEIPIWDYQKWVKEAFAEMDGNIAMLKKGTDKEIKNLRYRIDKLQKSKAETDSIQEIVAPNKLVNLVEKYDYESLLSASLKYEAALANLKIASMRSANNVENPESFSEDYFQKANFYYDLYLMSQEAKNTLAVQAARITDNNLNMHEEIINSLYGGKSQMQSGYKEKQASEIDNIMEKNLMNFKLYTINALYPDNLVIENGGASINARPYSGSFDQASDGSYITLSTVKDNSGNRYICGYKKTGANAANGFIAKVDTENNLIWLKDINAAQGGINKVVQILPSNSSDFVAVAVNINQGACKTVAMKMNTQGAQTAKAEMKSTLHPTMGCYNEIEDKVSIAFKGMSGNENTASKDDASVESAIFGQADAYTSPSFKLKGTIADIVPAGNGYMVICNYTDINAGGKSLQSASNVAAVRVDGQNIKADALEAGKDAKAFRAFQVNAETISVIGAYDKIDAEISASQKPAFMTLSADGKFTYHN